MKRAAELKTGRHLLDGTVAVVAGASRGAGRGIALALGSAGCTVYAVGRTARGGWSPADGAPGTIEDTVEEIAARGGKGVAIVADCTDPDQAASVFDRVRREQGRPTSRQRHLGRPRRLRDAWRSGGLVEPPILGAACGEALGDHDDLGPMCVLPDVGALASR